MNYSADAFLNDLQEADKTRVNSRQKSRRMKKNKKAYSDQFKSNLNVIIGSEEDIKRDIEKEFGEKIIITAIDLDDGLGYCKTEDGRKLWFKLTKSGKYKTKSLRPDN